MRKEYYNYVVKLPVLLHELFRGKVADYHFSDMMCTIRVKRVIKEINDLKINKKKQHSHADRHQQPQAVK